MNEITLRKVAFVAMPFGVKPTGLAPGKGPAEVNFDALWDNAIFPALSKLEYLPVRADNQTGSVIIKDMLEQLVFADLVLADITIPNGNVYYEAGVRHAARKTGCILISADWAMPLFDLAQITHVRYSLPQGQPADADYTTIKKELVDKLPGLVESVGPVFELTRAGETGQRDARHLKEISTLLFDFQNDLRAAEIKAANGEKDPLRGLAKSDDLANLPIYALQELVRIVRDYLEWGELVSLLNRLPENVTEKPYFREQRALAMSKRGDVHDAIALLETVKDKYGETPERLGIIGNRYRDLALEEPNKQRKRKHLAQSIRAYRLGMSLDLNQYYCAYKLIIALMERGRDSDRPEAERCAAIVKVATGRADSMGGADEWLESTMAVLAFFEKDYERARKIVDRILDQEWANWKLVGLSQDLESALGWIEGDDRDNFEEIFEDVHSSLPLSQEDLAESVLPRIKEAQQQFQKFQKVHARPATPGETIVSVTGDGEETTNTADEDEIVVRNLTEAREMYIVSKSTFDKRYTELEPVDEKWTLYAPTGEVMAIEITRELTRQLNVGEEFYIMASWGSEQLAREGDMFVSTIPDLKEIYRIARKEFEETYRLKSAE